MPAPSPAPRSVPTLWIAVLAIALLIGAAAALLSGTFTSGSSSTDVAYDPSSSLVGWIALLLGAAFLGFLVVERIRSGSVGLPTRVVVTILVVILVLIAFAVGARFIAGGGSTFNGSGGSPTNTSAGQNVSLPNGTGSVLGGNIDVFGFQLPAWALFGLLIVVLLIAGSVSARVLMRRGALPSGSSARARERAELRTLLVRAESALDDPEVDPRTALVELYAQLLRRIEPLTGDLETYTAEEIRTQHLTLLGVRPQGAEQLTRLFEVARYSTRPIDRAEVETARRALREAIADLDRREADA